VGLRLVLAFRRISAVVDGRPDSRGIVWRLVFYESYFTLINALLWWLWT
jgi:hypothetical protein